MGVRFRSERPSVSRRVIPVRRGERVISSAWDLRPAGFPQEKFFNAKDCYQLFRRGEPIQPALAKRAAPSREEAALVYRRGERVISSASARISNRIRSLQ